MIFSKIICEILPFRGITYTKGDPLCADKQSNQHDMRNLNKDNKRASELLNLLLNDGTDPATKEEIRAWLWSNVSNDAKDAAMTGLFQQMAPNMIPDEYDHKKYAELAARLNIEDPARMPVQKKKGIPLFRTPMRIAASVVLLLSLSGLTYRWLSRTGNGAGEYRLAKITVSADSLARYIQLPDGSSVELGANSELTYDENFTSGRHVHLDGEALLTVEKSTNEAGEAIPFAVTTDDLKIDVYGTAFRVIDPSDDEDTRSIVALYDGSVSVTANNTVITLERGEEYHYDHVAQKPDIGLILAREMLEHGFMPLLRFDESTLGNIITALTANYGVKFVMPEDIDLSKGRFSGDFHAEGLRNTLNILTKSSARLSFALNDDRVVVKRK